jgi:hypothetical protein
MNNLPPLPEAAINTFGNVCAFSPPLIAVQASGPLCDAIRIYGQACADYALEGAAKSDRADAERWRAAKELNAYALCNIAYQIKEACDFNTPDECMDAAIRAMKGRL